MRENPEEQVAYLFTEHRDGLLAFNKVNGDGGLLDMVTVPERLYLELDPKGRSIPTKDDAFIHVDGAWAFEQIASQEPQENTLHEHHDVMTGGCFPYQTQTLRTGTPGRCSLRR